MADLPPPVGSTASTSRPAASASAARRCPGRSRPKPSRSRASSSIGAVSSAFPGPALDELKAEPSLHAQVAAADVMVQGGGHLDDPVVLYVQVEVAAHAAVRADGGGDRLLRLVPRTGLPHVVLALEHQRAGGAHPDAVAAVDAGRVGQPDVELGGDAGVEPPARHRDGERVLGVLAAGLHALVAQDAARVVADVAVVVDLDRL